MGIDNTASQHWLLRHLPGPLRQRLRDALRQYRQRDARRALVRIGAADHPLPTMKLVLRHLRSEVAATMPANARHFDAVCGLPLENLWPDDVAGKLLEAHHAIEPGALLALDGPNRRIASMLSCTHPEHTVEFEPHEACELLQLAGFDIERNVGIWLCETDSGALLPFDGLTTAGLWPIKRRATEARERPGQSLLWWIEARRAQREPQAEALAARVAEFCSRAWPERLDRLSSVVGTSVTIGGETWYDSQGRTGTLMYGPHAAFLAGSYTAMLEFEYPKGCGPTAPVPTVHVSAGPSSETLLRKEVPRAEAGEPMQVTLEFNLPSATKNVQFVVVSPIGTRVRVRRKVTLAA